MSHIFNTRVTAGAASKKGQSAGGELETLLARVRSATGPDRQLECDIIRRFFGDDEASFHDEHCVQAYRVTENVDAILGVIAQLMPGKPYHLQSDGVFAKASIGTAFDRVDPCFTPALALTAAFISASIA